MSGGRGVVVLTEHMEQHPCLLQFPGMSTSIVHYWRPVPTTLSDYSSSSSSSSSSGGEQNENERKTKTSTTVKKGLQSVEAALKRHSLQETVVRLQSKTTVTPFPVVKLEPEDVSPLVFGDIDPGSICTVINTHLYTAPIYAHLTPRMQCRFLLVHCRLPLVATTDGIPTDTDDDDDDDDDVKRKNLNKTNNNYNNDNNNKRKWRLNTIAECYTMGQLQPKCEVPLPHSKMARLVFSHHKVRRFIERRLEHHQPVDMPLLHSVFGTRMEPRMRLIWNDVVKHFQAPTCTTTTTTTASTSSLLGPVDDTKRKKIIKKKPRYSSVGKQTEKEEEKKSRKREEEEEEEEKDDEEEEEKKKQDDGEDATDSKQNHHQEGGRKNNVKNKIRDKEDHNNNDDDDNKEEEEDEEKEKESLDVRSRVATIKQKELVECCAYESMTGACYRLRYHLVLGVMDPTALRRLMNLFTPETHAAELRVMAHLQRELYLAPWNQTRAFLVGKSKGGLTLSGRGNPLPRDCGFAFVTQGGKAVRGGVADGEPVRGGEADRETVHGGEANEETTGGGEETGGEADVEPVIGGEGGGARVETGEDWPVGKGRSTAAVRSGSKATVARIWSVGVGVCKWGKVPPSLNFVESY